jgi:hypothetical protein
MKNALLSLGRCIMSAPLITLAAMAALALCYVVAPIVADVFFRFRGRRTVRCPEAGLTADVEIDARHAAFSAIPGPPEVRVAACSLWPDRAGCAQQCIAQAAAR